MSQYRFIRNGTDVEVFNVKKGLVLTIKGTEVEDFIKDLKNIENNAPTCNDGHKYCTQHHTNWG